MRRPGASRARRALPQERGPRLWKPVLALLLAVVVGSSGYGSWAYWQDSAEVATGRFQAGTLDLRLDGDNAPGTGTGYTSSAMTWSGLVAGERLAFPLSVRNAGDPPMTYTATVRRGTDPAWTYDDSSVTVQISTGTRVADTTYPREETCSGTVLGNRVLVPVGDLSVMSSERRLAPGASEALCVVVGLDAASGNGNQGRTGSVVLTLTARQATQ